MASFSGEIKIYPIAVNTCLSLVLDIVSDITGIEEENDQRWLVVLQLSRE
jgi:hypothetical protein